MINKLTICLLILLFPFFLNAQNGCMTLESGRAVDITQTSDGGFAVGGQTNSFGAGAADFYIVKYDVGGNLEWTRTVGGANSDFGWSIEQVRDEGYIIAGHTFSPFAIGSRSFYIVKLDKDGNLQWTRTAGGSASNERAFSVIQSMDNGFAVVGRTTDGDSDLYIVKLNSNGNLQWTKTVASPQDENIFDVVQSSDSGYVVSGATQGFGAGGRDVYLVKLNSMGNLQWTRTIGGVNDDIGYAITKTMDGGYAVTGRTSSFGSGGFDVYFIKLDSAGFMEWSRTIGGANDDYAQSVIQNNDGSYVMAGRTASFGNGGTDLYVVKLDSAGNLLWTRTTGTTGNDLARRGLTPTTDGGCLVSGESNGQPYVVKLDANGNTCCSSDSGGTLTMGGGTIDSGGVVGTLDSVNFGGTVSSGGSDSLWCSSVCSPPAAPDTVMGDATPCEAAVKMYSIAAVQFADSYTWSVPGDWSIDTGQGTATIQVTVGTMTGNVCVTADNACGSSPVACLSVAPDTLPTASVTPENPAICTGDSVTLTANGGNNYSWNTSAISQTIDVSPSVNTTYFVTVTDGNGCSDDTFANVSVNPKPTANAGADKIICEGDSTNLKATGGNSYSWNPSGGLSCVNCQSPTASPNSSTTYSVNVTNSNGCQDRDSVKVTVTTCTGIDEVSGINDLSVYPNPNSGEFNIEFQSVSQENYSIRLLDIEGRLVYEEILKEYQGSYSQKVSLDTNSKGIYTLQLVTKEGMINRRIVIH